MYKIVKNTLQGDRIENPQYILDNNIEIDYMQYIEKQIMKPICQIIRDGSQVAMPGKTQIIAMTTSINIQ